MYLHELPVDHPDRTRSLVNVWYRPKEGKTWKQVKPAFKVAKFCYNELGPSWTDHDVFSFTKGA